MSVLKALVALHLLYLVTHRVDAYGFLVAHRGHRFAKDADLMGTNKIFQKIQPAGSQPLFI
jgi:hypothetical protein